MLPTSADGAFIFLGLFLAGMNKFNMWQAAKRGETFTAPAHLDCRHCNICNLDFIERDSEPEKESKED